MRQRLGLAASLLRNPRLLLLDEPTVGLDPAGARDMLAIVKTLASDGATVVVSSHNMAELEGVCDGVTVIRDGRSVWHGSMEQLRLESPAPAYRLETSDDVRAIELAKNDSGLEIVPDPGGWLTVTANREVLDDCVVTLGQIRHRGQAPRAPDDGAGVDVLLAHRRACGAGVGASGAGRDLGDTMTTDAAAVTTTDAPRDRAGVGAVYRVEITKIRAQLLPRAAAVICLIAPFAFAVFINTQSSVPADSLFGRWVQSSGFAIPFVLLGFAGIAGFPLIASVVAGDIFASEDRQSTWKTVLTRSCSRGQVFVGKTLAAMTFSVAMVALLGVSSAIAGMLVVGRQPLVGLSGELLERIARRSR